MPQPPSQSTTKKKKKGHAPAHQNTFAFRHNPHSKKTLTILNSPNVHVCRRCHDKIEWRKQYRKYKPLTQPTKCNHCLNRNVVAAYHTICVKCSTSSIKSQALLAEWNNNNNNQNDNVVDEKKEEKEDQALAVNTDTSTALGATTASQAAPAVVSTTEEKDTGGGGGAAAAASSEDGVEQQRMHRRVCAICVKEPALPCSDDEDEDDVESRLYAADGRKLKLREIKSLQRKRLQEKRSKKKKTSAATTNQEDDNDEANDSDDDDDASDVNQQQAIVPSKGGARQMDDDYTDNDDEEEDDDDPFLRAVGGADKLLTGEAYQAMLLEKE